MHQKLSNLDRQIEALPGWLSRCDISILKTIMRYQDLKDINGDILEIGCYLGKSAILFGALKKNDNELIVCDCFDDVVEEANYDENISSYPQLTRNAFEANYRNALGTLPTIIQADSKHLKNLLEKRVFRIVHIDGSHLYEYVRHDLDFARTFVEDGLIVLDDFRAQHTLGVTQALWESVIKSEVFPVIVSPSKIYLATKKNHGYLTEVFLELLSGEINYEWVLVSGSRCIRITGISDGEIYSSGKKLSQFIPPVMLPLARRIKRFFKAKNFLFRRTASIPVKRTKA